jgi:sporulation protein YqfC
VRKWAAEWLDLPADAVGDVPRLEMVGGFRMKVENHRGVVHFTENLIQLKVESGLLFIAGEGMKIRAIDPEGIWIEGRIRELRFAE